MQNGKRVLLFGPVVVLLFCCNACALGQLENTESGNGIRERERKRTVRAHAHDLNEWAGQPINMVNQVCVVSCTLYF